MCGTPPVCIGTGESGQLMLSLRQQVTSLSKLPPHLTRHLRGIMVAPGAVHAAVPEIPARRDQVSAQIQIVGSGADGIDSRGSAV